jgi:uncharacterized protein with PQ loop repeat
MPAHIIDNPSKITKAFIQIAVWAGPIMTFPQLYNIYILNQSQGVSTISWSAYTIVSIIWLYHGIRIQDRPLIINSLLYSIQSGLVVIGTLV